MIMPHSCTRAVVGIHFRDKDCTVLSVLLNSRVTYVVPDAITKQTQPDKGAVESIAFSLHLDC